jgi:hypothetical protein
VLATPGASSPIATLKCDEDVTIVYDEVGFYKVQVGKGTQGYISHLFVTNPMQKLLVRDGSHEGIARVGTSGIAARHVHIALILSTRQKRGQPNTRETSYLKPSSQLKGRQRTSALYE